MMASETLSVKTCCIDHWGAEGAEAAYLKADRGRCK